MQDPIVPPTAPKPAPGVGEVVGGRYALQVLLGTGGGGTVYEAVDKTTGDACALKLLNASMGNGLDLMRFKREYRAASRLVHPHCLRVWDQGEVDGHGYIAMDLMRGGDATALLGAAAESIVAMALEVLSALDHVHAKGIIHRDIKPQNILLREQPERTVVPFAKLCDFGIAKVGDFDDLVGAGSALGSLAYMAPEQLAHGASDPRSDLHALGVVLYEALAGRAPTENLEAGSVSEWIARRLALQIQPLRTVAPNVDADLATIVMSLLHADPALRPRTAADVYQALSAWLQTRVAWALPDTPPLENRDYLAAPAFVGRAHEEAKLDAFLRGVIDAHVNAPLSLCVAGKAGMGKSRLTNALVRHAEAADALVEVATCRAEPGPPFEPIANLLSALADMSHERSRTNVDETSTQVAKEWTSVDAQVFDVEGGALWDLYKQMSESLVAFSLERPCLVVLEDAQWADPHTLRLFAFAIRSAHAARRQGKPVKLGIVITHRFADEQETLAEIYEVGEGLETLETLRLTPLSDVAAAQLVASMLITSVDATLTAFTHKITSSSENNPLFIAQIMRSLVGKGTLRRVLGQWNLAELDASGVTLPATIMDAVGERAARFAVDTKELLAAASVVGRRFDLGVVKQVTGMDEPVLLDSLEEAIRAGFVVDISDERASFMFEHDRFREAIYEGLNAQQRVALHAKVARAMTDAHGDAPEFAADLAHHWRACQDLARAYRCSLIAAQYANGSFAYEQAARMYRQAVDDLKMQGISPTPQLLEEYADTCTRTGWYNDSAEIYRQLLPAQRGEARLEMLRKLGDIEFRRAHLDAAEGLQKEALQLLGVRIPQTTPGVLLGILWQALRGYFGIKKRFLRTTPLVGDRGKHWENVVETLHTMSRIYYLTDLLRAAYFGLAAGNAARKRGPSAASTAAISTAGAFWMSLGIFSLTLRHTEVARAWGSYARAQAEAGWAAVIDSMCYITAGVPEAAISACREAEQVLSKARMPHVLRSALEFHGEALLSAGRTQAALRKAADLWQLSVEIDDIEGRGWARYLEGLGHLQLGDSSGGMALLQEAIEHCVRGSALTYRLVAAARLHLERAYMGYTDMDALMKDAKVYFDRNLRAPLLHMDAAFLVATAMHRRDGVKLSEEVETHVRLVRTLRRLDHWINGSTEPLLLASMAAWQYVDGKVDVARAGFENAASLARTRGLQGELAEVLRAAVAFTKGDDAQRAAWVAEFQALRAGMLAQPEVTNT